MFDFLELKYLAFLLYVYFCGKFSESILWLDIIELASTDELPTKPNNADYRARCPGSWFVGVIVRLVSLAKIGMDNSILYRLPICINNNSRDLFFECVWVTTAYKQNSVQNIDAKCIPQFCFAKSIRLACLRRQNVSWAFWNEFKQNSNCVFCSVRVAFVI